MDISHIPKFFWYAIGISILVVSIGFTLISWQATSVSVEISAIKIQLERFKSQTQLDGLKSKTGSVISDAARLAKKLEQEAVVLAGIQSNLQMAKGRLVADFALQEKAQIGEKWTLEWADKAFKVPFQNVERAKSIKNEADAIIRQLDTLKESIADIKIMDE